MCGINGIFAHHPAASAVDHAELLRTRDYMTARGPDGCGEWIAADRRIGLGHRRLAIVDLSAGGAQPMFSADGTLAVTFNGEIYNYPELRRTLEARGRVFQTHCDTEVLLHLYAEKGADLVHELRGMFAFAIWDNSSHRLLLARDPYGIKPLYTANDGWTFRFASQVKALLAGNQVSRDPEPAGIVGFHLWGSVPEPFTLYRDIRALPAGCTQWVDKAGPREPFRYASLPAVLAESKCSRHSDTEIGETVREAVRNSVAAHLMADVEVGLFLSAGIDSGALLGLMRDAGQQKVKAVTLSFQEFAGTEEDESPLAAQIAHQYGAEHIVRRVSQSEFKADLPNLLQAMDQPSIDGVNTWFVSKAAREAGLKVALSGVGGDELLGGYPSFQQIPRWVRMLRWPAAIPGLGVLVREVASGLGLGALSPKRVGLLEYGGNYAGAYFLRRGLFLPFELKTQLDASLLREGMRRLRPVERVCETALQPRPSSAVARIVGLESTCYLRNQLLRDSDWAGMAHSVEIRTPLVDFDLFRAIAPVIPRLTPGSGKALIGYAASTPLPRRVVERRKTGFGVPTERWVDMASVAGAPASKGNASRAWAQMVGTSLIAPPARTLAAAGCGYD